VSQAETHQQFIAPEGRLCGLCVAPPTALSSSNRVGGLLDVHACSLAEEISDRDDAAPAGHMSTVPSAVISFAHNGARRRLGALGTFRALLWAAPARATSRATVVAVCAACADSSTDYDNVKQGPPMA